MLSNYDQLVIARDFRIRRTELTCPAHSLKMMTKAAGSEADEVILDLEDSCAVSQKVEARKTLDRGAQHARLQGQDPRVPPEQHPHQVLLQGRHRGRRSRGQEHRRHGAAQELRARRRAASPTAC